MKTINLLKQITLGGVMLSPTLLFAQNDPQHPNVIMLVADDWNDMLGAWGDQQAITPHMDRLAEMGVRFTSNQTAASYCTPSRTALMTGVGPWNSGCYGDQPHHYNLPDQKTIPFLFQKNGYATYGGGKVYHHMPGYVDLKGYDEYFHWNPEEKKKAWGLNSWKNNVATPDPIPYSDIAKATYDNFDIGAIPNEMEAEMADTKMVDWAVELLQQNHEKPFFLSAGVYAPHKPNFVPQKYFDLYPLDQIQKPAIIDGDEMDLPPFAQEIIEQRYNKVHKGLLSLENGWERALQAYLAAVSYADYQLGRILQALEDSPYAENTIVVFWSDNGYHLGEKKIWAKHTLWERTTNVPMIWAGPGIAQNKEYTGVTSLLDIYPTLAKTCNLKWAKGYDGKSLQNVLTNPDQVKDRAVITAQKEGKSFSVFTNQWHYINYEFGTAEELYDVENDPHEWNNLAENSDYESVLVELREHLPENPAELALGKEALKLVKTGESFKWKLKNQVTPPSSSEEHDLSDKVLLGASFPKQIVFRGEYIKSVHDSYGSWSSAALPTDGIIKKFVDVDELTNVKAESREWAETFLQEHPETMILNHWLARAHLNDKEGSSDRYFPGHWLSAPGSFLSETIDATQTSIQVDDISPFTQKIKHNGVDVPKFPTLMIVQRDAQGNKLWDTYEYVTIESLDDIDQQNGILTVTRGSALSSSHEHTAGTYICPMTARLGKQTAFDYNLSLDCPLDANGKTAADIMLEELTDYHENGGILSFADGISFDIVGWSPRNKEADTNNDGIADFGYQGNENRFAQGAFQLIQNVRQMLGDDRIMTSDGYIEQDQRAVCLMDGMESEGLVEVKDAYRGFAKTINIYTYWNEANTRTNKFSYIIPKLNNPLDEAEEANLRRLAAGTATCLGAGLTRFHTDEPTDEFTGGDLNEQQWLGKPVGEMIRLAQQEPNLYDDSWLQLSAWSTENCSLLVQNNELLVQGNSSDPRANCELSLSPIHVGNEGEDLVIYMEVEAIDSLVDFPQFIPRRFEVEAEGLPTYETKKSDNDFHNKLWGYMDTGHTRLLAFYYRNACGRDINLKITGEENGDFKIKKITAHQSAQLLAREFTNGVVLVNPSLQEQTFQLKQLFPRYYYKKLNGVSHPEYNTGEMLEDVVSVPAKDALFLYEAEEKIATTLEKVNHEKLTVYPNPVNEFLAIDSNGEALVSVTICDLSGRTLLKSKESKQKYVFNLQNFSSGVYFLRMEKSSGEVIVEKIIKN